MFSLNILLSQPPHSPRVTAAGVFPMSHSVPLSVLQTVAACHPPRPGEPLNHAFEAGSSSHHKEKSGVPLVCYLLFLLPHLPAQENLEEAACAFHSKVQPFLLHLLSSSRAEVFPKVVILSTTS